MIRIRQYSLYADEAPNGDYGAGPNAPALLQIATPTQVLLLLLLLLIIIETEITRRRSKG